jgi:hypothetical protein
LGVKGVGPLVKIFIATPIIKVALKNKITVGEMKKY